MNWFLVHDLISYSQHSNMIGNSVRKKGAQKPAYLKFSEISVGDKIVYYARGDYVIVGIFNVVTKMHYIKKDRYWGEVFVYKIEPFMLPPSGYYLDFKKLLHNEDIQFDMFPDKYNWGVQLMGKVCRIMTESDFLVIQSSLLNTDHLIISNKIKPSISREKRAESWKSPMSAL